MRATGWLRAPLVHFLAGGAALFWVVHGSPVVGVAHGERALDPFVVTAADVARLRGDYARETGIAPTDADEAALVEQAVQEELLVREALARGLDRNDRSVRNWLVEQMRVASDAPRDDAEALYARARELGLDRSDLVVRRMLVQKVRLLAGRAGERAPGDDELARWYAAHRDDYRAPARVSFRQVFVSSAAHGDAVLRDAAALLERLRAAGPPPAAASGGDPFVVPGRLVRQSASQVAKVFGPGFPAALEHAETRRWVGPIESPHGAHLVWVDAREAGEAPPLEAVRERVVERWRAEQRARRVAALVEHLKRRHPLQVESRAWHERSRS